VGRPFLGRAWRVVAVATAAFVVWLFAVWPPPAWYRAHWPRETAFMAMRRGQADPAEAKKRRYQPVPMDQIAGSVRDAVLVSEDHRFYIHGGIDYQEIRAALGYRRDDFRWSDARDRAALWRAFRTAWSRRSRIRGASTITQQLAKNLYLSPSRNPLRKVKEAVTAWRLESALGKERILELYLNVVEFGPEVWGVEAASQAYFRRPARRLRDDQAALLAATLPSPLRANPGLRASRLRWRQQLILRRMAGESIILPPPEEEPPEAPTTEQLPPPTASADSLAASPDTAAQR
jgi:monofunctional biosynthetic peptidoglycan transglycosylase